MSHAASAFRTLALPAAAALLFAASASHAQLLNSSFETYNGATWPSWSAFNNVTQQLGGAQDGTASVRLGGNFTGPFNVSGITQDIPASVGQVVQARMFFQNPANDPLQGDNFAVLNIEWYNANNQLIGADSIPAVNASTPTGVWQQVTGSSIAPCDTAAARIVPLFVQGAQLAGGTVLIDNASMAATGTADSLFVRNPGFEVEGFIPGWITFGNAFREFSFTRTGTGAIKFFGNFNAPFNVSGAYQTFCVQPETTYTLQAWAGTPTADAIRGGDFSVLNIEVFDAAGAPLNVYPDPNNPGTLVNYTTVPAVNGASTPGVYTQITNTTTMPANAAKARAVLLHIQASPTAGGGSTWFDDVTFVRAAPGCNSIDFNGDGLFPDDSDLVDFLTVLAGGTCSTSSCDSIDFNNDGLFPDDTDLIAFLRVLAGGTCN